MRTIIDLPDAQVRALDHLARDTRRSRAALIRRAVDDFLAHRRRDLGAEAFGLWSHHPVDGLAYQEKARSEW